MFGTRRNLQERARARDTPKVVVSFRKSDSVDFPSEVRIYYNDTRIQAQHVLLNGIAAGDPRAYNRYEKHKLYAGTVYLKLDGHQIGKT